MGNFRQNKKFGRREPYGRNDRGSGRNDRIMHSAVCDECGIRCEVPFKPTSGKPILCDQCFRKDDHYGSREHRDNSGFRDDNYGDRDNRGGGRREAYGRNDRGNGRRDDRRDDRMMHSAICDACGVKCEVPFKPTKGKPIYCSECFAKEKDGDRDTSDYQKPTQYQEEFDMLNEKLDMILKILQKKNRKEELAFLRTGDPATLEESIEEEVEVEKEKKPAKEKKEKKAKEKKVTKKAKKATKKKEVKKPTAKKATKAKTSKAKTTKAKK